MRDLHLELQTSSVPPSQVPDRFECEAEPGIIRVRGCLSTGSRGWRLQASAACRRSVIVMQITAVETPPGNTPDLEYHAYHATIRVHRRGQFHLKIRHGFRSVGVIGVTLPDPVYQATLAVP